MEIDLKKVVYIAVAVILALVGWQMVAKTNKRTERMIQETEGNVALDPSDLRGVTQKMEENLQAARKAVQEGRYEEASLKMYHAFPSFESVLMSQGYKEVEKGLTLQAWFDAKKQVLISAIQDEYPSMLAKIKSGDLSARAFDNFLNHMPFPFINEFQRKYRTADRESVMLARRENARGWFMVSVISVTGSGELYEQAVREALRRKWNDLPGLKLVLDTPMSGQEQQMAAKCISVRIEEQYVEYAFGAKQAHRGGERVPEKVTVSFRNETRRQDAPATSWDALSAVTAMHELPEKLTFKFENERQMADFSDFVANQRKTLALALASAMESVSRVELR